MLYLDSSESHTFSPDASLPSKVAPHFLGPAGASSTEQCCARTETQFEQLCVDKPLDQLPDVGAPCMVLHLQTVQIVNTRHVECSTRCVLSLGTHNPTNTTNCKYNETCRGTERKLQHKYKWDKSHKAGEVSYLSEFTGT